MSKLTTKQHAFGLEYCKDFNGTKACIRAGYSEKTAAEQASRLLKNVKVQELIQIRLNELSMASEEALKRLADIARGSVEPFLRANEDGRVFINLGSEEAKDNYNLLRKVKQTKTVTRGKDDYEREEVRTEFELHDAKSALVDILKMHGKFTDRVEISGELEHHINEVTVSIRSAPKS